MMETPVICGKKSDITVAIQGVAGAFHDIAARRYFGDHIRPVASETFADLFNHVSAGRADFGVVAIENSVAGSLLPNYTLLRDAGQHIHGEIYLRISQNLLGLPGQKIDDLKEVHSHPMAIAQSRVFFEKYPRIKFVEAADTASSAARIAREKLRDIGGIGSELAAEIYGLDILAAGIETNPRNYTRFLIVSPDACKEDWEEEPDKASLCFTLPHKVGALSHILATLAFYGIDLTKIQSLPIIGKEWEYLFYIDVVFTDYERYRQSITAITPLCDTLEILGEYHQGDNSYEQVHHQHPEA
ncbi:MAG: prephenate dehydratase [Lentisphaeria bacterium]|nr:prephenate dehydratase [Lentisphaeria bacterium]